MSSPSESRFRDLLEFARKNNLAELAWDDGDLKVAFRRDQIEAKATRSAAPSEAKAPEQVDLLVRSPMVGTFRRSEAKNRPPLVMEGNHIKPGDRLAIVDCMKIPNEVISYCAGEIRKILAQDGQPVEYGQPLFAVAPANDANGSEA